MKRKPYDARLPRNLTFRQASQTFYWRNPLTGKEISLGKISRRDAVAQALEANSYIQQKYSPVSLIEKIKGVDAMTVSKWVERYEVILSRRKLSAITLKIRHNQLAMISARMGRIALSAVTTQHVAEFLEPWVAEGKNTMVGNLRSVLSDMMREAIVAGLISNNPVQHTRAPKIDVVRQRLVFEDYVKIREGARALPAWFGHAMDLALVTGQRREDITLFRFDEIREGRLFVIQNKTGMRLALPLTLSLPVAGLVLGEVVERCREKNYSEYLLNPGRFPKTEKRNVHPDSLTKNFSRARKLSGVTFSSNPPPFHEIRSLSGRLYKDLHDESFAQSLLGHTSEVTTKIYLNERDEKSFLMI